jgi:serine O-acetyltransferase
MSRGATTDHSVSATEPDWSREVPRRWWDPSRRLLRSIRGHRAAARLPAVLRWPVRKFRGLQHRFWTVITGAEIDPGCEIGGGLLIPHPNGIVIHPKTRIGPNCLIFQQVTLGTTAGTPGVPRIGGHVDIGAGARILGPVTVGDHAVIGANAVVVRDVAPGATVGGVPARVLAGGSGSDTDPEP